MSKLSKRQEAALRYADSGLGMETMNIQVRAFLAGCRWMEEQALKEIRRDHEEDVTEERTKLEELS